MPHLTALTPDERETLPRMADKTVAVMTKTAAYATSIAFSAFQQVISAQNSGYWWV